MHAYVLELKLPTASEKIIRLFHCLLWLPHFRNGHERYVIQVEPSFFLLLQILPFTFIMATENKDV